MANADVNRLIDMLYERIEDAKSPALKPGMSIVDRDELLDLLDELRAQLPIEIKRAQELLSAREKFVEDAKRDVDRMMRQAELYNGLLAQFAVDHGATVIVRGVRNASDFDLEVQLARINQGIYSQLDTLFRPAAAEYQHFSSSMAREMIRYGQPLEKYLPAAILPLVREMRKDEEHG